MPSERQQTYRRRRVIAVGIIAIVVAVLLYLPFTLLAPLSYAHRTTTATAAPVTKAAQLAWPSFGASAIGAVGYPNVLSASGTAGPLPIASISKIVTALVTLDAKPLAVGEEGPTITFSAADHALYAKYVALQGTVKPMATGSSMSEHEVLEVSLVASANNYAEALADWAFGSNEAYVTATKAWLTSHGLSHTSLAEPTGIDPANTSTATDLIALGKLALANPVVAAIVDTKTATVPVVGAIKNTNELLGTSGVIGVKTGTLDTSGSNLLFASSFRVGGTSIVLVGVVIGAASHDALYPAVSALLAAAKSGFSEVTLTTEGQKFAAYTTPWHQASDAVASRTQKVVVWSDTPVSSVVSPASVQLAAKGSSAGVVTFTIGTSKVNIPLRFSRTIADPGPWWRLSNPFSTLNGN
jgi:D-alanyl-D-alanine carboxypeptidase (penicillin-binding protein 5/6)